jgi:hypothetical protein
LQEVISVLGIDSGRITGHPKVVRLVCAQGALPGEHRKVYSNRSKADFVMSSGIITIYFVLR